MANIFMLILVAFGAAFALVWCINYLPIHRTIFGYHYSPKIWFCKFLAPFDATMTFILICGSWIGLTTATLGINLMVSNTLSGIGVSFGVVFIKKVLLPKWKNQYKQIIEAENTVAF